MVVPIVAALAVGVVTARAATAQDADPIAAGQQLFETGCVSCHGPDGEGSGRGPGLTEAGAASADFYLSTGRMPHTSSPEDQPERKAPVYDKEEIADLVAYVASLGVGLPIPDIDPRRGDLQEGGELYRVNCAACHSASGAGGALSYGENAPSLAEATPLQVAEAIRIGPGQMPVFERQTVSDEEVDSLVRYVRYLQDPADPGGFSLGRVGPIPEGGVAILGGLGASLAAAWWIGRRRRQETP